MDDFIGFVCCAVLFFWLGTAAGRSIDVPYDDFKQGEHLCAVNGGMKGMDRLKTITCNNGAQFKLAELAKEQK